LSGPKGRSVFNTSSQKEVQEELHCDTRWEEE